MELASLLEHTLLAADATPRAIDDHCEAAMRAGLLAVCVSPAFVPRCRARLGKSRTKLVTVAGFPLGTTPAEVKVFEAKWAVREGADELDMVIPLGMAKAGEYRSVEAEVRLVRDAFPGVLKVILETGVLSPVELKEAAHAAVRGGADFLKTSTGFGPRGATIEDVQLLLSCCPKGVGVKASGGIRTRAQAIQLAEAGATRLGTSRAVAILSETV